MPENRRTAWATRPWRTARKRTGPEVEWAVRLLMVDGTLWTARAWAADDVTALDRTLIGVRIAFPAREAEVAHYRVTRADGTARIGRVHCLLISRSWRDPDRPLE
jgi:hypothetical protein